MNRINLGRVLMGGFVAGVIINIGEFMLNGVLLAEELNAAFAALNKSVDNSMIPYFVLMGFGLGFMLVWVYAAIRPRFGAGVRTAICASLTVWGLAYLYPNVFSIVTNMFPRGMVVIMTIWGLGELLIAGVAGAWVYKEPTATL